MVPLGSGRFRKVYSSSETIENGFEFLVQNQQRALSNSEGVVPTAGVRAAKIRFVFINNILDLSMVAIDYGKTV